jgi:hypothetical protein
MENQSINVTMNQSTFTNRNMCGKKIEKYLKSIIMRIKTTTPNVVSVSPGEGQIKFDIQTYYSLSCIFSLWPLLTKSKVNTCFNTVFVVVWGGEKFGPGLS